jgi:hypothetical protein
MMSMLCTPIGEPQLIPAAHDEADPNAHRIAGLLET